MAEASVYAELSKYLLKWLKEKGDRAGPDSEIQKSLYK